MLLNSSPLIIHLALWYIQQRPQMSLFLQVSREPLNQQAVSQSVRLTCHTAQVKNQTQSLCD